jgi:hypothetical protein
VSTSFSNKSELLLVVVVGSKTRVDKELLWGQVQEQTRHGFLVATRACFILVSLFLTSTLIRHCFLDTCFLKLTNNEELTTNRGAWKRNDTNEARVDQSTIKEANVWERGHGKGNGKWLEKKERSTAGKCSKQ